MMKFSFSWKTVLWEFLKLTLLLFIVANVVSYLRKPQLVDKTLPDLTITTIDGKQRSLHNNASKPTVLYFWGSWCPVCKMSSPVIDDLAKSYRVITFAVNSGSDEDIKSYMQQHNLHFPVVNDADGAVAQKFGVDTFPTLFIYNARGTNTFTDVGYTSSLSLRLKLFLSRFINQ